MNLAEALERENINLRQKIHDLEFEIINLKNLIIDPEETISKLKGCEGGV